MAYKPFPVTMPEVSSYQGVFVIGIKQSCHRHWFAKIVVNQTDVTQLVITVKENAITILFVANAKGKNAVGKYDF